MVGATSNVVFVVGEKIPFKPDTGQSPTLAHLAAPLATKLVAMATSLEGPKTNLRLSVYSHSVYQP